MKTTSFFISLVLSGLLCVATLKGQTTVIDFGADYSSSNINTATPPSSLVNGDFNFNGDADDRAFSVAFGQTHTAPNSPNWTTPSGKTGPVIRYGYSLANIGNTSDDPAMGLNRYNHTADTIQMTNAAGTSAMRMATAVFWEKESFLNGADSIANLTLADQADGISAGFVNSGTATTGNTRQARILVRDGDDWYFSADVFGGATGTLSFNPATANWHAYDPTSSSLLFYDTSNLGPTVVGSTFTNITGAGVLTQHELFDGSAANAAQHGLASLQVVAIPEPSQLALLFGGVAVALLLIRRHRS